MLKELFKVVKRVCCKRVAKVEKKSCWILQQWPKRVLLLFCGDRVEKLWNIVIGKAQLFKVKWITRNYHDLPRVRVSGNLTLQVENNSYCLEPAPLLLRLY